MECIQAFWRMNFQQDLLSTESVPAESPWLSSRLKITFASGIQWENVGSNCPTEGRNISHTELRRAIRSQDKITPAKLEKWGFTYFLINDYIRIDGSFYQTQAPDKLTPLYMAHTMEVSQLSDLINTEGRRFTREEWKDWVAVLHSDKIGSYPSDFFLTAQADKYEALMDMIGHTLEIEIISKSTPLQNSDDNTLVSIAEDGLLKYGYTRNSPQGVEYTLIHLDALGMPHTTPTTITSSGKIYNTCIWPHKHKDGTSGIMKASRGLVERGASQPLSCCCQP